jgi:cell division protein FtsQ
MSDAARSLFRRTSAPAENRQAKSGRTTRPAPAATRRASAEPASQPRRTNVYPPIVTRQGTSNTTPLSRRATSPARRQYYYALSTPGAEVRLPALPVLRPSWRMVSGAIVILMAFCLFALWNAPTFRIGSIELTGAQRITRPDVEAVLNVANTPAVTVSPAALKEALIAAFPEFSQVSVSLSFPADLSVSVTERQPVIAWQQDGKTSWIDLEGYSFPARGEPGVSLVTVQAEGSPPSLVQETPEEGTEAATAAAATVASVLNPEKAVPFLLPETIQPLAEMSAQAPAGMPLVYSPDYGLGWNDPQGWKVYFGHDTRNIDLKLKEYQAIVDYIIPRNIHPAMISVEFLHAPFYRTEP